MPRIKGSPCAPRATRRVQLRGGGPKAGREAYSLYVERPAEGPNEADGPFSSPGGQSGRGPATVCG